MVSDRKFYIIITRLKHISINQNRNQSVWLILIGINISLPMRNKFVYSCSLKICALEFHELLESIFCVLLVMESFSIEKVIEMFEETVVSWQEVRWGKTSRPILLPKYRDTLTEVQGSVTRTQAQTLWGRTSYPCSFSFWSAGCTNVVVKIWALSVDQCRSHRLCSFRCISSICWAYFSDVMISLGFRMV